MKRLTKTIGSFLFLLFFSALFSACAGDSKPVPEGSAVWSEMKPVSSMDLSYATQFEVDCYEGGYDLITIAGSERYLTIPEGSSVPEGLDEDITPIMLPVKNIYLAASSAMDLFRQAQALDIIRLTGTRQQDWTIPEITDRMEDGSILYGGKYSTPDYELLISEGCDLAIESTMIFHTPKVSEELKELGIPVLVERSSYEPEPLGRCEWIRLYGLLSGHDDLAEQFMEECADRLNAVLAKIEENNDKESLTAAFFYISSSGYVNVRKPGDYITRMMEIAGGKYVFADLIPEEENALSTINLQMESFYEYAVDADILIYNSTVETELTSMEQLISKDRVLADFRAVKEGNVWCTGQNMFQETTGVIGLIEDFYSVFSGEDGELHYLTKLSGE